MNRSRLILALGGLVAVVILAVGYFAGVSPFLNQAGEADQARAAAQAQNDIEQAKLDVLIAQFERLPEFEAELAALNAVVPSEAGLEGFYDDVQACAAAAGAPLVAITTGEAENFGTKEGAAVPAAVTEFLADYWAVPVSITGGEVSPDASLAFLSCIQGLDRLIFVSSASIAGGLGQAAAAPAPAPAPGRGAAVPAAPATTTGPLSIGAMIFVVHPPLSGEGASAPTPQPDAAASESTEQSPAETPAG